MLIDKILNTAFSFGAAVVIFGAWSKIEHNEYSVDTTDRPGAQQNIQGVSRILRG
ncbi:MAG: hypothetical protein JST68_23460 [Bacteroidetes bacterium]|nr:hypothetical protein [Bacteroidota bacterium]